MFKRSPAKLPITLFYPRVDSEADHPFLPQDPRTVLVLISFSSKRSFNLFRFLHFQLTGSYESEVPWLNGLTSKEGAWWAVHLFGDQADGRLDQFNKDILQTIKNMASEGFFSDKVAHSSKTERAY